MSLLVLASAATASGLTLKYFDARGAAETTRVLLAIGGIAYTDHRYAIGPGFEAPEFKADKESGALARNLGRAPLLLTDEGAIGQSKAMERYVAGQAGLMGKTPFEAACIDMVAEHVRDVRDAQARKGFSRMARGNVGPAAIGTVVFGSCQRGECNAQCGRTVSSEEHCRRPAQRFAEARARTCLSQHSPCLCTWMS